MPQGLNFGYGIQRLFDANMTFLRNSHPVYLRLRNFGDVQEEKWAQMGFAISPSGTDVGTADIEIVPPPKVTMVSVHNIGQSVGKLRFGARVFTISATFVDKQVKAQGITDQDLVWRDPKVVGLILDGQTFSIEDIAHEELAGKTVAWVITANAPEQVKK